MAEINGINMVSVVSSNINSVGYDPERKVLAVEFKGGAVYHYEDVEQSDYNGLITSPSVGRYINQNIKSHSSSRIS